MSGSNQTKLSKSHCQSRRHDLLFNWMQSQTYIKYS